MAMNRLNKLYLTYNSSGGIPTFVNQFKECLQDLKDAEEPMSDILTKSMFLSKIQDRDYRHIVDNFMDINYNFEECVTQILDKYNLMNPPKNQPFRQNNSFKSHHKGNNRLNRTNRRNNSNNKANNNDNQRR